MTVALLFFVVGAAAGVICGWYLANNRINAREVELEKELSESRAEMERYRGEVVRHFETTAAIFSEVSSAYRHLHHHLIEGYESLTGSPAGRLLPDAGTAVIADIARPAPGSTESPPAGDEKSAAGEERDETDSGYAELDEEARSELDRQGVDIEEALPELMADRVDYGQDAYEEEARRVGADLPDGGSPDDDNASAGEEPPGADDKAVGEAPEDAGKDGGESRPDPARQ